MITLQSSPPVVFFAGNPVTYKIHTDNALKSEGLPCSFALVVSAADTTAGHTISFTFPSKTIVFTTAVSPDDSGLQIPKASNSTLFSAWAQSLYDCFQSNFEISSRFNITLGAGTSYNKPILFVATNKGVKSTCTVTMNLVTVTLMSMVTGVDPIAQNDFCIIGGLWDKNKRQIAQDTMPVDANGDVTFDFSEYLNALLDYNSLAHLTYPFDPAVNLKIFTDFPLPFYAGFAERYGGEIRKIHFDTLKNAFPGGLNRETLVFYNSQSADFFSIPANQQSFLTWAPVSKISDRTVPEKLFFYCGPAPTYDVLYLMVDVHFTNGTTQSLDFHLEVQANNVLECSCGYSQLAFDTLYPTLTVSSWDVWLSMGDWPVSEVRSFTIDPVEYENERIFIFQNSFGRAYDVVRFTGKGSTNIDIEFLTGNCENSELVTAFNAPSKKFSPSESQRMKANSGWVSREMKDYFRELLLSRQVFEYKDSLLYPIVITTNSVKEHFIDDQYLFSLEIEYDRAYRDFFFFKV